MGRVGLTRRRAQCFVRLWAYLFLKYARPTTTPPLTHLGVPSDWVECTCREAADVFYSGRERGSDRAAGMMLDKLTALGLIRKYFDGNTTQIAIQPLPELIDPVRTVNPIPIQPDGFDPRCDAIPIAHLLAANYNWMNRNAEAVPYRIANILRDWASHYGRGLRVLRRTDTLHPIGFYAMYPIARRSEVNFFNSPNKGLHLSTVADIDPFEIATLGDPTCRAVFVRSWMIEGTLREQCLEMFLTDAQQTLRQMRQDFPNLCDMYTLIIHPSYEELAQFVGFQRSGVDLNSSIYWMYLPLDRFLNLNVEGAMITPPVPQL